MANAADVRGMDAISDAIQRALVETIEREQEQAIQEAVVEFEQRLRLAVAKVTMSVGEFFHVQRGDRNLVITVEHRPGRVSAP